MIFAQNSPYMKKLLEKIDPLSEHSMLIDSNFTESISSESILLLEEESIDFFKPYFIKFSHIYLIHENETRKPFINTTENIQYLSKFQSYKIIQSIIENKKFQLSILTHAENSFIRDDEAALFMEKYHLDYLHSLDFHPQSSFSLFTIIHSEKNKNDLELEKYKLYKIITSLKDYFSPPDEEIDFLIQKLLNKGHVGIITSCLKNSMDLKLVEIANLLIYISPEFGFKESEFIHSLRLLNKNLKIDQLV